MEALSNTVPLNRIIPWPENPRTERADETVLQMARNIKHQGLIMPIMVMEAKSGFYYAIDGETRRQALNHLVNTDQMESDAPVAVKQLPATTPASQVLALAIAANTIRHDMGPVDYFTAFSKLAGEGMKPSRIADMFDMTVQDVRGLLLLADLIPDALDLVRTGRRTVAWAKAMTIASPAQQAKIVARIGANNNEYDTAEAVKAEIKNNGIPESSALFDPGLLADSLKHDLFSQQTADGIFSDVAAFWQLQNVAIDDLVAQLEKTHSEVLLVRGYRFDDTGWTTGGEPSTSVAVVIVHDDGSVSQRLGMVPPAQADTDQDTKDFLGLLGDDQNDADADADVATANTPAYVSPLARASRDTQSYLDTQTRIGMRSEIADNTRLAKACIVASTVTRTSIIASPLSASSVSATDATQQTAAHDTIAFQRTRRDAIATRSGIAGQSCPATVLALVLDLHDDEIDILFNWAVAESCRISLDGIGAQLHAAANVPIMPEWRVDTVYLNTLSNMQIRALADEYLPVTERPSAKASIGTVRSAILAYANDLAMQNDWTGQTPSWTPPQVTQHQPDNTTATVPPADLSDDQLLAA